jgi:hypothetical protein
MILFFDMNNYIKTKKHCDQEQGHLIYFENDLKIKNWRIPEGAYRVVLMDSEIENEAHIFRFQVISLHDEIYEYWVRNRYRFEDKKKLRAHLINWLGEAEFRNLIKDGIINLQDLYGREADVFVKFISSGNREPLRVIEAIAPPGTMVNVPETLENSKNLI